MVTWQELVQRGVVSSHEKGEIVFDAPDGMADELRAEIYRRAPAMATPLDNLARSGKCSACGDPLPSYQGGWCPLCTAARKVALRDRKANT